MSDCSSVILFLSWTTLEFAFKLHFLLLSFLIIITKLMKAGSVIINILNSIVCLLWAKKRSKSIA